MISNITRHIVYTLQLNKVGVVLASKIFALYSDNNIQSDDDYYLFIIKLIRNPQGLKLSHLTEKDVALAIEIGKRIIEDSDSIRISIISTFDESYPKRLKFNKDRPLILNYRGNLNALSKKSIGIIGSRKASKDSLGNAYFLGNYFAQRGYNVLSGLALGCDTSAHLGALSASGITTAILPCGLDKVHPKSNDKLANQILEQDGLLISEYFLGVTPMKGFYVQRDRLQALFSDHLVNVQSKIDGGSMHASNYAMSIKRNVAAFDCEGNDQIYSGNLHLFEKGAFRLNNNNIDQFLLLGSDQQNMDEEQLRLF